MFRVAQALLDVDRTPHRFDGAGEFGKHRVTRSVEDTAARSRDEIVGDGPVRGKTAQRLLFVLGNQPRVAGNIGRENRRDLAFHESQPRTTIRGRMPPEVPRRNRLAALVTPSRMLGFIRMPERLARFSAAPSN
jgi:hypothetical protein